MWVGMHAMRASTSASHARTHNTALRHRTMDEYEEAVLFTFSLLESRLDRLEYVLGGAADAGRDGPKTIVERIHRIEQSLQQLAGKTALLDEANNLCKDEHGAAYMAEGLLRADTSSKQAQGRAEA